MYYVYILYSDKIEKYYCGQCNDIFARLIRHNSGETKSIKHGIPWKIVGFLEVETRSEAMILEKKIKKRGIERWISHYNNTLIQPG